MNIVFTATIYCDGNAKDGSDCQSKIITTDLTKSLTKTLKPRGWSTYHELNYCPVCTHKYAEADFEARAERAIAVNQ